MKLFDFLIAAKAVTALPKIENGLVTTLCDGDTNLFIVGCDAQNHKMNVKIDEKCREQYYSHIDFANSFIQGKKDITTVEKIVDVFPDCKDTEYMPTTTTGNFEWKMELNGDCREVNNDGTYNFYWNAGKYFIATVPLECTAEKLELDSSKFEIEKLEFSEISKSLDADELKKSLKLVLKASPALENPSDATNIHLEPALQKLGAAKDYVAVSEANIGQHVELVLENADTADVLGEYSMSLNQCWGSKTDDPEDHDFNQDRGHVLLWDEFCPKFPWVGPLAFTTDPESDLSAKHGYLGEYWVTSQGIQKIHFRQFGWTNEKDEVYYHCVIKVCDKKLDEKCATVQLKSSDATECNAVTYAAPIASNPISRRRRRSPIAATQSSVSVGIQVQPISASACANLSEDNSICYGN